MADLGFPLNIVDQIIISLKRNLPDHTIIPRPVRYTDPSQSVGVFPVDLTPDRENSSFIGQREPAINRYLIRVQNFIKASDEETGRSLFAIDAKKVRVILYRDADLLVALAALQETIFGSKERFSRFGINRQRFLNNDLKGSFVYLTQTDVWVETEIIQGG